MEEVTIAIVFEHKKIRNGFWELIPKEYIICSSFDVDDSDFEYDNDDDYDVKYKFVDESNFFGEGIGYPISLSESEDDSKIETIAKSYFEQIRRIKHFERVNGAGKKYFYQVNEDNSLLATNIINYYSEDNSELICKKICDKSGNLDMDRIYNILKANKHNYEKMIKKSKKNNLNNREKYDSILNVHEAYEKLSKYIISQDEALKQVLLTIRNNIQKVDKGYPLSNILLIGPTGVGKTLIANAVADVLGVPYASIDASNCSAPGYMGSDITGCLKNLYIKANCDIEQAQKGIIFIDELDKLAIKDTQDYVKTIAVQDTLLKMVEGQDYDLFENDIYVGPVILNTAKITFIAAGAFETITSPKIEKNIGFESQDITLPNYKKDIDKKVIQYGMKSELMGRFNKVLLNPLKVEDIIKIILSEKSIFNYYLEVFKDYGIEFKRSDNFIETLAKYSMKKNGGARGINQVLESVFGDCLWEILESDKKFTELSVSEEIVTDPKKYILK